MHIFYIISGVLLILKLTLYPAITWMLVLLPIILPVGLWLVMIITLTATVLLMPRRSLNVTMIKGKK